MGLKEESSRYTGALANALMSLYIHICPNWATDGNPSHMEYNIKGRWDDLVEEAERYKQELMALSLRYEELREVHKNNSYAYKDEAEKLRAELSRVKNDAFILHHQNINNDMQIEELEAEIVDTKEQLDYLATEIWKLEYKNTSPGFALIDTAVGVVSQIDCMVAGIISNRDKLRAELTVTKAELAQAKDSVEFVYYSSPDERRDIRNDIAGEIEGMDEVLRFNNKQNILLAIAQRVRKGEVGHAQANEL